MGSLPEDLNIVVEHRNPEARLRSSEQSSPLVEESDAVDTKLVQFPPAL